MEKKKKLLIVFLSFILFFFMVIPKVFAETVREANAKPVIKIGKTVGASGESGQVGLDMILGTQIYFDKINAQGGIDGFKLKLIALNDGYEPLKAAANVRQLIDQDHVLALVGDNGTPGTVVIVPIIEQKKVLLYGTYSGGAFLRTLPPNRYIFTFRAGFNSEAEEEIKDLKNMGIKLDEIAFFIQNDAYGEEVYDASIRALKAAGLSNPEILPVGYFARNTLNVERAFAQILNQIPPKAIILAGNYGSNATFIKFAHKRLPHTYFIVVTALVKESDLTKDEQDYVLATNVVPPPDSDLPVAHEYLNDLRQYGHGAQPNFTSFESYLGTKLFVMALRKAIAENKLSREGIIDVLESMHNIDIGMNEKISFSKDNHQAINKIYPLKIKNGKFVVSNWAELKGK